MQAGNKKDAPTMTYAYVIFDNDSSKAVNLASREAAEKIRKHLRNQDFKHQKHKYESFEDYKESHYWHVRTVPLKV